MVRVLLDGAVRGVCSRGSADTGMAEDTTRTNGHVRARTLHTTRTEGTRSDKPPTDVEF